MNIPRGLNDLLPDEVLKRKLLEKKINQIFHQWGYREVMIPTFELFDILARGSGSIIKREMIKFFDREGNIIALRPEMTTSIARLASTKLKQEPGPLRLHYMGNVFRHDYKLGIQREFSQAGAELIGINNRKADAEMIALAIACLKNSGLNKFYVDIDHVNFFNGIMTSLNVEEERRKEIKQAIMDKDFVQLEKILSLGDIKKEEKEFILKIHTLRGGIEVLKEAEKMINNNLSRSALKEIEEVYQLLKDYGLNDHILIDLGIIRNFDYYTGIIFEGYSDYLGYPICGGGRYDNLCAKFGKDLPSTGFAIGMERLSTVLEKEDIISLKADTPDKVLVYYGNNNKLFQKANIVANKFREKGYIVEMDVGAWNYKEALNYARYYKMSYILVIGNSETNNKIKKINIISGEEEFITYD